MNHIQKREKPYGSREDWTGYDQIVNVPFTAHSEKAARARIEN